jgi:hypothetical protein
VRRGAGGAAEESRERERAAMGRGRESGGLGFEAGGGVLGGAGWWEGVVAKCLEGVFAKGQFSLL